MTALLIALALLALMPVAHGVWVLIYALSPRWRLEERLKEYTERA